MRGSRAPAAGTDALGEILAAPFARDEIRLVTVPAPGADPRSLLALETDGPAIYWSAADGPTVAGLGAAALVRGAGPDRAAEVGRAAGELWPRIRSVAAGGVAPLAPRLFGGFAFLAERPAAPWADFGEATFVLPRVLYEADGEVGRLAVAVTEAQWREDGPDAVTRLVASTLAALEAHGADRPDRGEDDREAAGARRTEARRARSAAGPGARAEWVRIVESIQRRIDTGRAEKIVAARVHELRLRAPVDLSEALGRLGTGAAEARFAFRFGGAAFLGATPERLVSRRGLEIRTEAVAGSIEADGTDRAAELRSSLKDDAEHGFVVRAIADALAPVCHRLDYPAEPDVKRLRHVLHLRTPFDGTLTRPVPVLELVARLHPTPAVGGTPTAEALDWIAREEPGCRGWYGAPVGWFDGDGDGDFVVALRSALVDGDRALLYAGAGIVRDSDVDAELAETDVKLRTMLDALGADG
jgi:salicylate biosynthesis isochorismate synthase